MAKITESTDDSDKGNAAAYRAFKMVKMEEKNTGLLWKPSRLIG